jgi:adenylyltransferase/sulfurtransferase
MLEIGVEEVKSRLDRGDRLHLIDVREPQEIAICALEGAERIPMMSLFAGLQQTEADPGAEIVVYCHTGIRSLEAARYLRMQGYPGALSMAGGIDAWAVRIDPAMARY